MENYIYIVCCLGYDKEDDPTDTEIFLEEFENPKEALEFAEKFRTLEDILEYVKDEGPIYDFNPEEGDYLELRVEQCVECEPEDETDPEEGYTECVDVLFEERLYSEDEE